MSVDGLIPSVLLSFLGLFGGLWARGVSKQLADMKEGVRRLAARYETDMREIVLERGQRNERDAQTERRLRELEQGRVSTMHA